MFHTSICFGGLLQVVLQFPSLFWDDSVDYFGAAPDGGPERRGLCSTFWNLHRWSGQPLLTGLLSGLSADQVRTERHFRYRIFLRFLCQCGGPAESVQDCR